MFLGTNFRIKAKRNKLQLTLIGHQRDIYVEVDKDLSCLQLQNGSRGTRVRYLLIESSFRVANDDPKTSFYDENLIKNAIKKYVHCRMKCLFNYI